MAIQCVSSQYIRACTGSNSNTCSGTVTQGFAIVTPQPLTYTNCLEVIASPTDFSSSAFNITAAEGAQLSAAIVAVWAIAFAVRMGIRATNVDES
jgi:hypothetical protein